VRRSVFLSRLVKLNVDSNRRARDEENKRKIVKRNGRFKARKTNPHFSLHFNMSGCAARPSR